MVSPGTLDCAPLDPSVGSSVSDSDLRRIEGLQRVLLSPLDYPCIDSWRSAAGRAAVDAFGGDAAMFQLDLPGIALHHADHVGDDRLEQYTELLPELERTRGLSRAMKTLGAGNRSMAWGSNLEWLYESDYFNELVVAARTFDPLWVAASRGPERHPAVLHVYHDQRRPSRHFDAVDVQLMRLVRPALDAGVRTVVETVKRRASIVAMVDSLLDGGLIYDLEGDLLHRSPTVARVAVTRRAERPILDAARELAVALGAARRDTGIAPVDSARTVRTRTGTVRLTAVLLGEGTFESGPAVLVTITRGESPLPDRDGLRERFGLTRRQAEVALLLARRKTNPEIAEILCISEHTVRSHTEAVMGKLGVNDRRDVAERIR